MPASHATPALDHLRVAFDVDEHRGAVEASVKALQDFVASSAHLSAAGTGLLAVGAAAEYALMSAR